MTQAQKLTVTRLPCRIEPNPGRVIARQFIPGDEARIRGIIERALAIPEEEANQLANQLQESFNARHKNLVIAVADHYDAIKAFVPDEGSVSTRRKILIGTYFTMEYAIEAAALFNPSMVPAVDQSGLPAGSTRFFMSLRATGEGHISSIVFRRGVVDANNNIDIEPASPFSRQLDVAEDARYSKEQFRQKLIEIGAYNDTAEKILDRSPDPITLATLNQAVEETRQAGDAPETISEQVETVLSVARSNYSLEVAEGTDPSEVVIFPVSEAESRGIEDVRLVQFTDDEGALRYYGTYTAYNGRCIMPQLLEIVQRGGGAPIRIFVHTMSGRQVQNKGMALFPRKLDGRYAMIGRLDNENLFLMYSDNIRHWDEAQILQKPRFPWEIVQIGNCGSPLETDAGWLLLTHGVGPMRRYCIGASLLDREDPSKVIGRTREPLLMPSEDERSGYVPNVVYSCGGMIHNESVIIPYAMSDMVSGFATVPLPELLTVLRKGG
jgi:predicted GH43/DUF377 family glycosyl hydrolase